MKQNHPFPLISLFFCLALVSLLLGVDDPRPVALAAGPLTLPPGFIDEVAVGGLYSPRAFVFAPDGRIFIAERGSDSSSDQNFYSIRVFKDGALLPTRAITFDTCGDSERGFLGIALDPNFSTNGYLYVYYTRQSPPGSGIIPCAYNTYTDGTVGPRNRISRVTMVGDTIDPATERVLVDNIVTDVGYHNAGDLHFGADGYLYASVGEGGISTLAPDTGTLNGKILRLLPTDGDPRGYVTTGNPFDTAPSARYCGPIPPEAGTGPCREVFAYGFRNPFRFDFQPGTSIPFVGDVGGGVWEEVDQVTPGANYGWPTREGPCPSGVNCPPVLPSGFADPVYWYAHQAIYTNNDSAVIGGAFYTGTITGTTYPAEYVNNYFFADFVRGFVRRLVYDSGSGSWNAVTPDFGTGGVGIIGLKTGLDGNLYYLNFLSVSTATSEVRRIRYAPGANQPPIGLISVNPQNGPLNTPYTFSAAGSYDPDNNLPLSYNWDFGDGVLTTTASITVTHTYNLTETKTITLTVTDNGGPPMMSTPVTTTVFPGNIPPTGTIVLTNTTDLNRTQYYAGDTWQFAVTNVSDDQPPLPANPYSWDVVFHHRSHTHPGPFSALQAPGGQFTIPLLGETDPQVWYRVTLRITDAQGQTTTIDQDLYPVTTTVTLDTSPLGGQVILEGGTFGAPDTVTRVVGINIGIDVPSPQIIGGNTYTFSAWAHGGNQSQTIAVPPGGGTYLALLTTKIWLPLIIRQAGP